MAAGLHTSRALCRQEKDNVRQRRALLMLITRGTCLCRCRRAHNPDFAKIEDQGSTKHALHATRHAMHHIGLILLDFFVLQYDARPQQNCTFEAPALYLTRVSIVLL
jgi:hypothetical protein